MTQITPVCSRWWCSCAVVDGYRCVNEGGQLQVEVLHAHLGIATCGALLVKKRWRQNEYPWTHTEHRRKHVHTERCAPVGLMLK